MCADPVPVKGGPNRQSGDEDKQNRPGKNLPGTLMRTRCSHDPLLAPRTVNRRSIEFTMRKTPPEFNRKPPPYEFRTVKNSRIGNSRGSAAWGCSRYGRDIFPPAELAFPFRSGGCWATIRRRRPFCRAERNVSAKEGMCDLLLWCFC